MLDIIQIPVLNDNYVYLLHEPVSGETAVVDPAVAEPVLELLHAKNWGLKYILNTHHHHDHIGGNFRLKQQYAAKIVASEKDMFNIPDIDIPVIEGNHIHLGALQLEIIATPGHTLGHIVFYSTETHDLFSGDTLFSMGCGRLFEGSAEQMQQSLQRLKCLPADCKIYCAHEYTQSNGRFALNLEPHNPELKQRIREVDKLRQHNLPTLPTTMESECAVNPFLRLDDPILRQKLGFDATTPATTVFSRIRKLKDEFH